MIYLKVFSRVGHNYYIAKLSTFGEYYLSFGKTLEESVLNMLKYGNVEFNLPVSIVRIDYRSYSERAELSEL